MISVPLYLFIVIVVQYLMTIIFVSDSYPFVNKSARFRREPNLPNAVSDAAVGSGSAGQVGVQKSKSVSDKRPLPRAFSGPGIRNRGQVSFCLYLNLLTSHKISSF